MEARSILKSIQTEESKLAQSPNLTRSDRHYFRARYNYYRLSLLRLPSEERVLLESTLQQFQGSINAAEVQSLDDEDPAPFLTTVSKEDVLVAKRPPMMAAAPAPTPTSPALPPIVTSFVTSPDLGPKPDDMPKAALQGISVQDAIGELQLIKVALASELTPEARKILADGVDRVIRRLRIKA